MMTGTQMIRRAAVLCAGILATPSLACGELGQDSDESASALGAVVPPSQLIGSYDPTNGFLRSPQIKDWAGSALLSGFYGYDGMHYTVDYVLQPSADGTQYTSQSSLTVMYGPMRCSYPVAIEVNPTIDSAGAVNLYVRDNVPSDIPPSLPVGFPCPRLQNVWRVHPQPYVKRGATQVFAAMMDDLCGEITARTSVVESGKPLAAGPIGDIPPNIYHATGSWQSLSTPVRDVQLRASFRNVFRYVSQAATGPSAHDVAVQLMGVWNQHQNTCHFQYKTSNGAPVPFTLNDVQSRLFQLSFDPYHCTEMRWGAFPDHVAEYASCNTQSEPYVKRFNDEKTMRNVIDQPPPGTPTPIGYGPPEHQDVDVVALLQRLTVN
jgi:hypothetical protein